MEVINELDWGVYAHFRYQIGLHPELLPIMQAAYYLSDYLGIGVLFSLAAALFLIQGKRRSAQVTALSLALALALVFGVRFLVPRLRPPDAQVWLGAEDMRGSYPSAGVFLFMLAMIFIGFAVWGLARSRWLRGLYVVVAALLIAWVCVSEFFLAIHFLSDVLGGMAGATLIGWIAYGWLDREATGTGATPESKTPPGAIQDLSHARGTQES
jgi:membrane-associated phospholipid phosphatase